MKFKTNQRPVTLSNRIDGVPLKTFFLVASYQFLGTYDLKYYVDAGDGYAEGIGKDPETHLYPEHAKSSKEIGIVEVKGKVFHAITTLLYKFSL